MLTSGIVKTWLIREQTAARHRSKRASQPAICLHNMLHKEDLTIWRTRSQDWRWRPLEWHMERDSHVRIDCVGRKKRSALAS